MAKKKSKRADVEVFFRLDEVLAFRHELTSESDRGCALMAAAYLDDQLGLLLKSRFVDDSKVSKELFDHIAPLGTFSARVDMAYMLGLLSSTARRDLHLIRKIRNSFGHTAAPMTFEQPSIAARCRELNHHALNAKGDSPRAIFVQAVLGITGVIHAEILTVSRPTNSPEPPLGTELKLCQMDRMRRINEVLDGVGENVKLSSKEEYLSFLKSVIFASMLPQPTEKTGREKKANRGSGSEK